MALIKLQFRPGVNRDTTSYSGEGGFYECDKIRFRSGFPQKLGGWVKSTPTAFLGVCRQLWNWITTFSDDFMALGTNEKLYIEAGGYFYDITPLRDTNPTLAGANSVNTTIATTTVTINLGVSHNATTGSFVTISGSTAVGGVPAAEINDNHQITVTTATAFTFAVATMATSSVSNGGGAATSIDFEIEPGNASATYGVGWGAGTWGREAWGLGATSALILEPQRDWWLDNFDNDLVANIRNGAPYWWERGTMDDPATALATRAITLQQLATNEGNDPNAVPAQVMQLMTSQTDKHLIAFGAVPFGSTDIADFDPLLIRWSDQDNPSQWTPEVTNSSGFLRVSRGSRIVRGLPVRQEILVWTDTALYSLQFLGTTDVYGLQEYADNISMASPRACITASNITYWMGQDKFYAYTGRVETLPCTLRDHVFNNINFNQSDQIICGTNEGWNEVWWFYPSASSDWNDKYVIYNHLEQLWYYGDMERTAWLDTPLRAWPQAADSTSAAIQGYLYNHENGVNDDTAPMAAFITSNDFDLGDGDQFILTQRIIPDVDFAGSTATNASVTMTIKPRYFPGSAYITDTADTQPVIETSVTTYTEQVFIRARARQMAFKIASADLGVTWSLGSPRLQGRPDGAR